MVTDICRTSYRRSQGISLVITGKQNGERQCGKYLLGQVSHELQCTCYPKKPALQGWHCDSAFSLEPLCPAWHWAAPVAPLHPCFCTVPVSVVGRWHPAIHSTTWPSQVSLLVQQSAWAEQSCCMSDVHGNLWSLGGSKMKQHRDHEELERDPTAGILLEQSSLEEWSSPPGPWEQDLKCRRITYAKP